MATALLLINNFDGYFSSSIFFLLFLLLFRFLLADTMPINWKMAGRTYSVPMWIASRWISWYFLREREKKHFLWNIDFHSFDDADSCCGGTLRFIGIDILPMKGNFQASHSTMSIPSIHIQFFLSYLNSAFKRRKGILIFFFPLLRWVRNKFFFFCLQILFSAQHNCMPNICLNYIA